MKIMHRLGVITSTAVVTAALGLAAVPLPASASVARHIALTAAGTDFIIGSKYTIADYPDATYFMYRSDTFQGQIRIDDPATEGNFIPISSRSFGGVAYYQWQIAGSSDCLEYDSSTSALVADACSSSLASQYWWYDANDFAFHSLVGGSGGPCWFVQTEGNNEPVYVGACNTPGSKWSVLN